MHISGATRKRNVSTTAVAQLTCEFASLCIIIHRSASFSLILRPPAQAGQFPRCRDPNPTQLQPIADVGGRPRAELKAYFLPCENLSTSCEGTPLQPLYLAYSLTLIVLHVPIAGAVSVVYDISSWSGDSTVEKTGSPLHDHAPDHKAVGGHSLGPPSCTRAGCWFCALAQSNPCVAEVTG